MTAPAIEAFWSWWEVEGRARCDEAIEAGSWDDVVVDLQALVHEIDPQLEWEFGPGRLSRHVLCVTGAGNAEMRPTSERWLLAAPPSDDAWEFRSARAADPSAFEDTSHFEFDDRSVSPADLRIGVLADEERQVMDVEVWHPALAGAPEDVRGSAIFLMIDWLLGEDAVERWIGTIDLADAEPEGALSPTEFATAVEELERANLEPTYAVLSGSVEDRPLLVVARRPLKRVEFPLFDLRLDARLILADATSDGLPDPDRLEDLTAIEEDLTSRLSEQGVLAAVVTHDGVRKFHVYCDQEGRAPAIAQEWVSAHPEETIVLSFELDPGWEAVASFC